VGGGGTHGGHKKALGLAQDAEKEREERSRGRLFQVCQGSKCKGAIADCELLNL